MVYKKGVLSRYGRTSYPGATTAKVASRALYIASKCARALNTEKKYHDLRAANTFVGGPQVLLLNGVAQGDGASTRDGDQLKMIKIQTNLVLQNDSTPSVYFRALLVLDKQSDGAAPAFTEIFDSGTAATAPLQFMNLDNNMRFRIIKDCGLHSVEGKKATDPGGERNIKLISVYKEFHDNKKKGVDGIKVRFSGATSGVGDISTNALYLILIPSTNTTSLSYEYNSRMRYVDN